MRLRRLIVVVTLGAVVAGLSASQPLAVSTNIVVSQVYGGGGNTGATYTHDFIELFNLGSSSGAVDGWAVADASGSGTGTGRPPRGTPAALATIVALVGYGNANYFEGTLPPPAPSNTPAALRGADG